MARVDARLANLLGALGLGIADTVADAAVLDDRDLNSSVALVALLDFAPAGSVSTLSRIIGLTHSGAVRLVGRLEALGYVERRAGVDARSVAVVLTAAGRRQAKALRLRRQEALSGVLGGLTSEQKEGLTAVCEKLVSNLTAQRLQMRSGGALPSGGALCRMCDLVACGRPHGRCPAEQRARPSVSRTAAHG